MIRDGGGYAGWQFGRELELRDGGRSWGAFRNGESGDM